MWWQRRCARRSAGPVDLMREINAGIAVTGWKVHWNIARVFTPELPRWDYVDYSDFTRPFRIFFLSQSNTKGCLMLCFTVSHNSVIWQTKIFVIQHICGQPIKFSFLIPDGKLLCNLISFMFHQLFFSFQLFVLFFFLSFFCLENFLVVLFLINLFIKSDSYLKKSMMICRQNQIIYFYIVTVLKLIINLSSG